jgi:hypothetical protein
MRRSVVTTVIFCAAILSIADATYAQNPPWCAIMDNDGNTQCNYYTEQQCLQTLSGIGGRCILNPAGNAPNDGQRAPLFAPFSRFAPSSENAQGLQQLQSQDPGPPPGLGVPPPPNN